MGGGPGGVSFSFGLFYLLSAYLISFYLEDKETERCSVCWFAASHDRGRLKPGAWNSIQLAHVHDRVGQKQVSCRLLPLRAHSNRKLHWKWQSQDLSQASRYGVGHAKWHFSR